MHDEDPKLIVSPLNGTFVRNGIAVEVLIYRLEEQSHWTLEVVDKENNSIVWDDEFPSYQDAYAQFVSDVEREGLAKVISGEPPPTLS